MRRLLMLPLLLLFALAAVFGLLRFVWAVFTNETKAWAIAKAFDRLGNAVTNGADTETISSRAAKARDQHRLWAVVLCALLDLIECDHCNKSRGI